MLHSVGAWRTQDFPTWLPSQRCILLGWGFQCASIPSTKISKDPSTLYFLCQNHASLHWVSKELKSTAKSRIAFAFVGICSKGGNWSLWVHLIASEPWWTAGKPGFSCVQRQGSQKSLFSFYQIPPNPKALVKLSSATETISLTQSLWWKSLWLWRQ